VASPPLDTATATLPGRRSPVRSRPVAAIDLGSNNCRLLIAQGERGGFRVIDAFSRIVRLGERVGETGRLSDAAMDRSIAALKVCAAKMRRRGVGKARAVATEAARRAANADRFRDRVRAETGLELEVIGPEEEARLALAGCAPLLDPAADHALVFDIGGGSTELMWLATGAIGAAGADAPDAPGAGLRPVDWISLPFGVVTLAERHGADLMPEPVYRGAVAATVAAIEAFERRHAIRDRIAEGRVQMIGCSGTVTTLAGVAMDLPRYDRSRVDGTWLDFAEARSTGRRLMRLGHFGRAAHPCIGPDRADLVVAGCAVLEGICQVWPVGRLRIADRGVREGILMDLIAAG
jgi:exopolyphosphatase/guanosine-5'-triphosphate,3'-diphosphate pyrophosphatase